MPPEMRAPGQRSLISGSASMNAFAKLVVLLDPRRDGEHVRVEDDVLGREAGLVDEQVVGALADRDLALDRVRLSLLVERHHDHGRRRAPDAPRLREERLLALLERDRVDDALALDALEAGLEHLKRELSTMIGIRATSGSVAIRFRNVVIASTASSRSASMFTSRRFAPPRTCSSATSTARW